MTGGSSGDLAADNAAAAVPAVNWRSGYNAHAVERLQADAMLVRALVVALPRVPAAAMGALDEAVAFSALLLRSGADPRRLLDATARAPGAELAALDPPRRAAAALARYRDVGSTASFFGPKAKTKYPSRLAIAALAKELLLEER